VKPISELELARTLERGDGRARIPCILRHPNSMLR
jgi:hypothetical protein